jgi:ATP-binding protein involved in chromosome partitioning
MTLRYRDVVGDGGSDVAGQLDQQKQRLRERMNRITHKVAVMSGKGGVGKSTVTINLAVAAAAAGCRVGVLDADIYGPSLAKMLGLRGQRPQMGEDGFEPPTTADGIKLMSMDFLLPRDDAPVVWEGPREETFAWNGILEMQALREFLTDTRWGELDLLVIDLPPGTSQFSSLLGLMPDLAGSLVVSIPTEVSRLVVNRSIAMLKESLKARVLGVIENMSAYYHVEDGRQLPLFGTTPDDGYGAPIIARIPFDPRLAETCDRGTPYVRCHPDTPTAAGYRAIWNLLQTQLEEEPAP